MKASEGQQETAKANRNWRAEKVRALAATKLQFGSDIAREAMKANIYTQEDFEQFGWNGLTHQIESFLKEPDERGLPKMKPLQDGRWQNLSLFDEDELRWLIQKTVTEVANDHISLRRLADYFVERFPDAKPVAIPLLVYRKNT